MHFCPRTKTTHTESINSDLQRGNGTVRRRRFGDAVSATDFSAIDTSAMGHFGDRHFGDWTFRRCTYRTLRRQDISATGDTSAMGHFGDRHFDGPFRQWDISDLRI